jgi:hypothetical protein
MIRCRSVPSSEDVGEEAAIVVIARQYEVVRGDAIQKRGDFPIRLVCSHPEREIPRQDDEVRLPVLRLTQRPPGVVLHIDAVRMVFVGIQVQVGNLNDSHP